MKRLLIGAIALVFSVTTFAQNQGTTPQERADKLTETMKTQLELTDQQVIEVAPINLKMTQAMSEVNKEDPNSTMLVDQIKADYQADLAEILTPEQLTKAKEMGDKKRQMRKKPKW